MPVKLNKDVLVINRENGKGELRLDFGNLKKAVLTLRAINHPLRKEIITFLEEKKKLTVTEIYVKLRMEQSVISQHLAMLRKAGVVNTEREGKYIYYSINKERIADVSALVDDLA
jgi:DNA-binding transcriptional ArsR family regulator